MATMRDRKVVDKVDLPLFVYPLQALRVASNPIDKELEVAARRRESVWEQRRVRNRYSSAEVINSELGGNPLIAVIGSHFVADLGFDKLSEANRHGLNGGRKGLRGAQHTKGTSLVDT